jgi:hypothetical protein
VSVTQEHLAIIEEGQRLRGWIANAYAQIEFLLGDMIVQSLTMAEYQELSKVLPHGSPTRIKRVRKILELEGFFSEFKEELMKIIGEFETHHETRNLLAHGFCQFLFNDTDDCGFQFRKWHRVEGHQDVMLQKTFRLVDLEYEKAIIVELSERAVKLFFEIHRRLGLVGQ